MAIFELPRSNPEKTLERLKKFEDFCAGSTFMTPDQFNKINMELSLDAMALIGKCYRQEKTDGPHLIWTGEDREIHDLGLLESLDPFREAPGFHKKRTWALLEKDLWAHVEFKITSDKRPMTVAKMRVNQADGSGITGVGPDAKTALRNAALKRHLQTAFNAARGRSLWDRLFGWA